MRIYLPCLLFLLCAACDQTRTDVYEGGENQTQNTMTMKPLMPTGIDLQGHRGCRGLMPENTIQGFLHALDLGVSTLEMDAVITSDQKVLLSHEPWFSHEICLDPQGNEIPQEAEQSYRIFGMTYEEARAYDCGMKPHPRFLNQKKLAASKPLLRDVIQACEAYAIKMGRPLPFYNVETKCLPEGDGLMHPAPDVFADLLVGVLNAEGVLNRSTIQSFDVRSLQHLNGQYPSLRLALLVENSNSAKLNLEKLGFTPHIYSPSYLLVDSQLVAFCDSNAMALIPWTVNETAEMEHLLNLGVDGLISDFPDRFPPLQP
jgi:glycerophosphoryl diester phosphodiesterase